MTTDERSTPGDSLSVADKLTGLRVTAFHVLNGSKIEFASLEDCRQSLGDAFCDYECFYSYLKPGGSRTEIPVRRASHEGISATTKNLTMVRLVSDRYDWVIDFVAKAAGRTISRFRISELLGYGAETLVFSACDDNGAKYVIKTPWDPSSQCLSRDAMARRRQRLEHEARILRQYCLPWFPSFVELVYDRPVIPATPGELKSPFLVEEWIDGAPADQAGVIVGSRASLERTSTVIDCLGSLADLQIRLASIECIYTDVKPSNILLGRGSPRFVDAASVSYLVDGNVRNPRITISCLPADVYQRYMKEPSEFALSASDVVRITGRVCASLLSGQPLIRGQDLASGEWSEGDNREGKILRSLIEGKIESFETVRDALSGL